MPELEEAFRQGLRALDYVEGESIVVEYRHTQGASERLPDLAAELVSLGMEVIVAAGSEQTVAARNATSTIPIVFTIGDPLASGWVTNLARPDGNTTGLSSIVSATAAKRLQLLKEALPHLARVAVLWNPTNPLKPAELQEVERSAAVLGLQLESLAVRLATDLDAALQAATSAHADALFVLAENITINARARIAEFAGLSRLPAMYELREFTDAGGLMSYGVNRADMWRRSATYVDKILKGARPSDLPIEQPTKFDFVVNLPTARAIGLTIPPSVLQQATEIIQ